MAKSRIFDPTHSATVVEPPVDREVYEPSPMQQREINALVKPKSIKMGRTLTRQLESLAHAKNMLFECRSEFFEEELPLGGRSEKKAMATLLDIVDWTVPDDPRIVTLVCNAVMISALKRSGGSLTGRFFVASAGAIRADKQYRSMDVREVEVER